MLSPPTSLYLSTVDWHRVAGAGGLCHLGRCREQVLVSLSVWHTPSVSLFLEDFHVWASQSPRQGLKPMTSKAFLMQ